MAKQYYRGNLSAAIFPMTLAGSGRAVIMPGIDQNFDRRVDPAGEQKDAGIPQAIYMENVFPTTSGYQSAGYLQPKIAMPLGGLSVDDVIELDVKIGNVFTKVPVFSLSNNTTYLSGATGQGTVTIVGANPNGKLGEFASTAVVNDIAYLYAGGKLYTVTGSSPEALTFTDITATVTPASFLSNVGIVKIAGSNNYLIAANSDTIYYSSLTTPTDFVSSLISGAGSIRPNDLKGSILRLAETQNGFYILASESTLLAKYTGNNRYPWKFMACKNVSGAPAKFGAFYGNINSKGQYVVDTNNQIKFLSDDTAEDIGPEVSEFLANGSLQQVYISSLKRFAQGRIVTKDARIYTFNERYILVSMDNSGAQGNFAAILVYDILLKRYGKLNILHKQIFTATIFRISDTNVGNVRQVIGILQGSGVFFVELGPYGAASSYSDYNILTQQSVLVLGKFQYVRSRWLKLHEVEIEGVRDLVIYPNALNFTCALLASTDGYTFADGFPLISSFTKEGLIKYPAHTTCQNFALALEGSFDISTVQLSFSPAGER